MKHYKYLGTKTGRFIYKGRLVEPKTTDPRFESCPSFVRIECDLTTIEDRIIYYFPHSSCGPVLAGPSIKPNSR